VVRWQPSHTTAVGRQINKPLVSQWPR
jgi:hypothetical protein